MPFVTRLTLQSGDRESLERVVTDIKQRASRKGVEMRGPNPEPLEERRVPMQKRLDADDESFGPWRYTVYVRTITIIGHDDFARTVAGDEYPPGIHLGADVERVQSAG
jgi:ribosomal protein S10